MKVRGSWENKGEKGERGGVWFGIPENVFLESEEKNVTKVRNVHRTLESECSVFLYLFRG